jgi:hypothetical protein
MAAADVVQLGSEKGAPTASLSTAIQEASHLPGVPFGWAIRSGHHESRAYCVTRPGRSGGAAG